jgi:hypothetical protein
MKDSIDVRAGDVNSTVISIKRLADEIKWLLKHLEDERDFINIRIVRENETGHRITLTIDKPDKPERKDDEQKDEANPTTGI